MSGMVLPNQLPPELDQAMRGELQKDERLVWLGVPDARAFSRAHRGVMVFGIVFAGFALFWMAGPYLFMGATTASNRPPLGFTLFGVPFFVVGAALASSPLWMRRKATRSAYAITDRRAIVIEGSLLRGSRTVKSFGADQLTSLARVDRRDGTGDLVFEQIKAGYQQNDQDVYRPRGFLGIKDVREVERLLRDTLMPS